jgi:hypothetical protein
VCAQAFAVPVALPDFNVDIDQTSVSGLSSGGFMAVQFSVAYSSIIKGAGVVAGGPYFCAQGDLDIATRRCSCTGFPLISRCRVGPGSTDVPRLIDVTDQSERDGTIDALINLARQRIWLFSGTLDSVVPPPVMNDLYAYYRHYIGEDNIQFRKDVPAQHAMPTDAFGKACDDLGKPYINNCGIDAAGDLLKWIYGELNAKGASGLHGRLIEFDQSEFIDDHRPHVHGIADTGFAYVPGNCDKGINQPCRLHVAFHGCEQNVDSVGDKFIRNAGYNAWADANNIIVLYPQTAAKAGRNPKACWNWFDFDRNEPNYANKQGRQMQAVKAMIDRVAGLTLPPHPVYKCYTATNIEHVLSGRARDKYFLAFANGSGSFMGLDNVFTISTLKQTGPNFFVVGNCG